MRICEGFFSGMKKEWMIPLFTFYIIVELKKKYLVILAFKGI